MRITIPGWVDDGHKNEHAKTVARLKYAINLLGVYTTGTGTIASFARHCGIDRSGLTYSVNVGRVTASMAVKIEQIVGSDVINHRMLMNPMEIPTDE